LSEFINLIFIYVTAQEELNLHQDDFHQKRAVESYKDRILTFYKSNVEKIYDRNIEIDRRIKQMRTSLISEKKFDEVKLLDLILDLNREIVEKFKNYKYETLEDLFIIQNKYKTIREHFNNPRVNIRNLSDFLHCMSGGFRLTEEYFLAILNEKSFEEVVLRLERFKNFLRKI